MAGWSVDWIAYLKMWGRYETGAIRVEESDACISVITACHLLLAMLKF